MLIRTNDILLLLKSVRSQPMNMQEIDFTGNIWNAITRDKPTITDKQYKYLKGLADRKILNDNTTVIENGS